MFLDGWQIAAQSALTELRSRVDGGSGTVGGGIYLWGSVGRGKSMLMDQFYDAVCKAKQRKHFHQFFVDLHRAAHRIGSMSSAVDQAVDEIDVLCFDEFHVDDVADAILLSRVLDAIIRRKVTLVVTSNVPPSDLLPNPLFHDKFLPSIALIEESLDVIELGGSIDYRLSGSAGPTDGRFASGRFLVDEKSAAVGPEERIVLTVGRRQLTCAAIRDREIQFDFEMLCSAPTSASDYLELADAYDAWVILGVPVLRNVPEFALRRFGNVVDVLYDRNVRLTVVAAAPLDVLVDGIRGQEGAARLCSRLGLLSHRP
ncbi:cell division protein ZapE [Rhodococcus sp. 27YEA15]|uniref:cell division protein ZapE n=1 Tax=Rhodococcus sp. 27YEA15 TaxID=3156259 RepID=UPI003C7BE64B